MKRIRWWFFGFRAGFWEPDDVQDLWYFMADSLTRAYYNGFKAGARVRRFLGERQPDE